MIHESITPLQALYVAIGSMLVVFTVLLLLFLAIKLMAVVFGEKPVKAAPAPAEPKEDEDEMAAVVMAVLQMYLEEEQTVNPMVRKAPKRIVASFISDDPTVRDCAR